MTIAACHVSPEGVILGTDSTSTVKQSGKQGKVYHRDYEQKVFEVGCRGSTVGMATWGIGRFGKVSHRTIAAKLGEICTSDRASLSSMKDLADRLRDEVSRLISATFGSSWSQAISMVRKWKSAQYDVSSLTPDQWKFVEAVDARCTGGYFLAGRLKEATECEAFEIKWTVLDEGLVVIPLEYEQPNFRGVPDIMQRLVLGYDEDLPYRLMGSGKWKGTPEELQDVLSRGQLTVRPDLLPLRDAIDWVHTVIHTTIRATKFAGSHVCGGPVELAVITTDRPFRWVCHKELDAAIITAQEGKVRWPQEVRDAKL